MESLETGGRSAPEGRPRWHVGFDCATKTFAFSVCYVDFEGFRAAAPALRARARACAEMLRRAEGSAPEEALNLHRSARRALEALDKEVGGFLKIADGETVDLFPGRPDDDVGTVERIKAVSKYIRERVRPSVAARVPPSERLRIVIEFQMGQNSRARTVASALVALFADDDVIIVGPSLKNKVFVCEEGRYGNFASKYAAAYGANKAHAKFNFAVLEAAFGTEIPETKPKSLRGHIADSFMQVLGYLIYGPDEKMAASMF
jgi:hypothetical protein